MDALRNRRASLAPTLSVKAILAVGPLTSQDAAIGRHTKPLVRLRKHERIRLGLEDRSIVHWQRGKIRAIVDVTPR
jgi:hypothetical protein